MSATLLKFAATILLVVPLAAFSAETTYAFDTVTAVNMRHNNPSISGIEKDTGNQITESLADNTNISFRYVVDRCIPVFLTALENPGRNKKNKTEKPTETNVALKSCQIEVKILLHN